MDYIKTLDIDFHKLPENSETRYIFKIIIDIIEFIQQNPDLKTLPVIDYHEKLFERYKDFSDRYFNIFMLVIENKIEDDTLINVLKVKAAIELNYITQSTGDAYISELIAEKYLYPTFGSKENYEQTVKKLQNRKTRREMERKQEKEAKMKKEHKNKIKK